MNDTDRDFQLWHDECFGEGWSMKEIEDCTDCDGPCFTTEDRPKLRVRWGYAMFWMTYVAGVVYLGAHVIAWVLR